MTELVAKPVLKNKYWIVESEGSKVATIQAVDNGGFVYVNDNYREQFNTIKLLSKAYNVKFDKQYTTKHQAKSTQKTIYEYPIQGTAYNIMWDIKHKFPVYSKNSKSKSFFCAGYYVVKLNNEWTTAFCPKLITLNRYEFFGPYRTQQETQTKLDSLSHGK